jgi:hypothetical protein
MYRPGSGTWYSAQWVISQAGAVDVAFDYENEPEWSDPVPVSIFFVRDLAKFPRDDASIPEWVRRKLELAKVEYPED